MYDIVFSFPIYTFSLFYDWMSPYQCVTCMYRRCRWCTQLHIATVKRVKFHKALLSFYDLTRGYIILPFLSLLFSAFSLTSATERTHFVRYYQTLYVFFLHYYWKKFNHEIFIHPYCTIKNSLGFFHDILSTKLSCYCMPDMCQWNLGTVNRKAIIMTEQWIFSTT